MTAEPTILERNLAVLTPGELPALTKEQAWEMIDRLETAMLAAGGDLNGEQTQPLTHRFTPGLYTREILNPAGSLIVTKIHKTEHQFILIEGTLSIWTFEEGWRTVTGPHIGATQPGTRRIIYAHTDARLMTMHPTSPMGLGDDTLDHTFLERIEEAIIEKRVRHLPTPPAGNERQESTDPGAQAQLPVH